MNDLKYIFGCFLLMAHYIACPSRPVLMFALCDFNLASSLWFSGSHFEHVQCGNTLEVKHRFISVILCLWGARLCPWFSLFALGATVFNRVVWCCVLCCEHVIQEQFLWFCGKMASCFLLAMSFVQILVQS